MKDISVLLVDHSPLLVQLLTRYLQWEEHVQVTGVTSEKEDILDRAREIQPDVILIDLDASWYNSVDLIACLRNALPNGLVIAMTMMDTIYYRKAVLEAGADELILKTNLSASFLIFIHTRLKNRKQKKFLPRSILVNVPEYSDPS